jgi:hypothetical protein
MEDVKKEKRSYSREEIPAVTQLFTPHWIVRYLVENSLGRLWLLNRPNSRLRDHMPYYIEGEPETDFLKITKPEEIRLCDPAVGSGHMLTYAFDLLTLIYEEEGYTPSEIPALILRHNLHGLEICPRAAQLAELALVFKAREKSRRFFQPEHLVRPNITELQDIRFEDGELQAYFKALGRQPSALHPQLAKLLHQFEDAKNYGSLIRPCLAETEIQSVRFAMQNSTSILQNSDLMVGAIHRKVLRVLDQAEALTQRYHVVVANPPYLSHRGMNAKLRVFMQESYEPFKSDLFAAFISRGATLSLKGGRLGYMSPNVWMFISSHEDLRRHLLSVQRLDCLVELPLTGFTGATVQICAFCFSNCSDRDNRASYIQLTDFRGAEFMAEKTLEAVSNPHCGWHFKVASRELEELPGSPLAYWVSEKFRKSFGNAKSLGALAQPVLGMTSSDNNRFLRRWFEPSYSKIGLGCAGHDAAFASRKKWFPYNKGGEFRKWYGNNDYLINWEDRGREVLGFATERYGSASKQIRNQGLFFKPSVTWSFVNSAQFGVRRSDPGFIFDVGGSSAFPPKDFFGFVTALLCSSVAPRFLKALNPTLNFQAGNLSSIPLPKSLGTSPPPEFDIIAAESVQIARTDWDNFETSWDFRDQPLLRPGLKGATLEASWRNWEAQSTAAICRMQDLETENNRLFIAAYGLDGELQPEVPEAQITLARAEARLDMAGFLSYAVGCMMGRYSPDHPGLILANAGDTLENFRSKIVDGGLRMDDLSFAPDDDAIIPVLDGEWFEDDIVARTRDFLRATFGEATLKQNLRFIEDSLGKSLDKYFLTDFYKEHLQTYKKRPIYWLFQSPKKGFSALVYVHRYTKDTVNTLLNKYLRDYLKKLESRINHLVHVEATATATKEKNAARKEAEKLKKDLKDCQDWERNTILPLAQARLEIDLDDGVKTNYLKFTGAVQPIPGLAAKED